MVGFGGYYFFTLPNLAFKINVYHLIFTEFNFLLSFFLHTGKNIIIKSTGSKQWDNQSRETGFKTILVIVFYSRRSHRSYSIDQDLRHITKKYYYYYYYTSQHLLSYHKFPNIVFN